MSVSQIIYLVSGVIGLAVAVGLIKWILSLRIVVPTNMVHIVQKKKTSVPYGRGKASGNVYFNFPSWLPLIGVVVTQFQESIFQVNLKNYDAYDSARLPFVIDVSAFFKVADAETVAQRVASFNELLLQLEAILQGAVRRILATTKLEDIMQERSALGDKFTEEVQMQIKEWGVESVKTIEFMDIRDASGSKVISDIMAKEKSRIEMESRVAVANNTQTAETKEIFAQQTIEITKQESKQQIGIKTADTEREVGISQELAQQQILDQQKTTKEKTMAVKQVSDVKQADIDKQVAIVQAEQKKQETLINSDALLYQAQQNAQSIKLEGSAKAEAERLMLEAPVMAQTKLAESIGTNKEYQNYLITIKKIEVDGEVQKANAVALEHSDLKLLVNSGDVQSGLNKFTDLLSSKGGASLSSMLQAINQSDEGRALLNKFIGGIPTGDSGNFPIVKNDVTN